MGGGASCKEGHSCNRKDSLVVFYRVDRVVPARISSDQMIQPAERMQGETNCMRPKNEINIALIRE